MRPFLTLAAPLAGLAAVTLSAAPALAALAPKDRADLMVLGNCAAVIGVYHAALDNGGGDDSSRERYDRAKTAMDKAAGALTAKGILIEEAESDAMQEEILASIKARLTPFAGQEDVANKIIGEFNPDVETCAAKTLPDLAAAAPAGSGT